MIRRNVLGGLGLMLNCVLASGCFSDSPSESKSSAMLVPASCTSPVARADEQPHIELTPRARSNLLAYVKETHPQGDWWLAIRLEWGGCSGYSVKLDLARSLTADEIEIWAGDVCCAVQKKQKALIQGIRIDWQTTEKTKGFSVTYPNQTEETKRLVKESVDAFIEEAKRKEKGMP